MPDENITTLLPEGDAPASATQDSTVTSQEASKNQDDSSSVVERANQQPPSDGGTRLKPSDFYSQRKQFRELKQQYDLLSQQLQELRKPAQLSVSPTASQFDTNEFWANPQTALEKLKAQWFSEWESKRLPEITSAQLKSRELEGKMQEALEIIFPKSNAQDERDVNERANSDPRKLDRINRILNVWGLNQLSKTHPVEAARMALEKYEQELKGSGKNSLAPKKGQMVSTSTSTQTGGKNVTDPAELAKEMERLEEMETNDPDIRFDEKFIARKEALIKQLSMLPLKRR